MTKQYWIGGFFIDLSRNQITQNNQSRTIPPKALAVLTVLAENQGQVVSQDELLTKVWQDTVVSPNTLQRSIAQLRKALGDDGKDQAYIQTHAKQGYSLECDVRWSDKFESTGTNRLQDNVVDKTSIPAASSDAYTANKPQASNFNLRSISIFTGILILGILGYQYLAPKQNSQLTFDNLRSLTTTDDKEFDATYTPDGEHIVFQRFSGRSCVNKLWAKNVNTQKETQLTSDWGNYGSHSFSKDGKKLVFLATEACSEPVAQQSCYNLMSLDFEKALTSSQNPNILLQCQNSQVKNPVWLNNSNIALLQKKSDRWKLISYSISENNSVDLYDLKEGNIIDYAYSANDNLIAVVTIHSDNQQYIEMFKPDGRLLSSNVIKRPQEIPKFRNIYPSFDPLNKQLIFSTGRQLFTLSYEGDVTKISLPFAEMMTRPEFHPDGKSLVLIKGEYDSDIVLLSRDQLAMPGSETQAKHNSLNQTETYSSIERTNLGEDHAIFQPGGESIAFWSERTGDEQIWIRDGDAARQLTNFPIDTYISGFDWSADGSSLLVNANKVLTQVSLDSIQTSFPFEYPVLRLFQWDSKNHKALSLVRIEGIIKLVEYDLNTSEIREITDKTILWARKSDDGQLIYKDKMSQFWQPGPVEDQRITQLTRHKGKSKSFVLDANVIYSINSEDQLWSYDLDSNSFETLGKVSEDVDYITDINQTQLLMTVEVYSKKEVVELSLGE